MTLGQRVAVMRDGKLQQVDVPQHLYEEPTNLFVAAFIGSPAMNLVEGTIDDDAVVLGAGGGSESSGRGPGRVRIPLARDRRPESADNGHVIVGIRPEAFEDAAFTSGSLPQVEVQVAVLEELGADAYVFFEFAGRPVVVEEARSDEEDDATSKFLADDRPLFTARVDPRTSAHLGENVTLAVDPSRLYFFSPETGESLLGNTVAAATA
jgi:multiple sugar transport system ATP-binding protein